MTLRKLLLLFDEYKKEHYPQQKKQTLDDVIPF